MIGSITLYSDEKRICIKPCDCNSFYANGKLHSCPIDKLKQDWILDFLSDNLNSSRLSEKDLHKYYDIFTLILRSQPCKKKEE